MQKLSLLTTLCLLPALAFAQAPDVRFEDPGAFDLNGTEINTEANNFNICFVDANICIYPQQAEDTTGSCGWESMMNKIHYKHTGSISTSVIQREEYSSLLVLYRNIEKLGTYPSTHYEVCRSTATHTYGALCVGPEGNQRLTYCSLISEDRSKRRAYKW